MPLYTASNENSSPILHDPATWRNDLFAWYVTQARWRDREALQLDGLEEYQGRSELFISRYCNRSTLVNKFIPLDSHVRGQNGDPIPVRELRMGGPRFWDAEGYHLLKVEGAENVGDLRHVLVEEPICPGASKGSVSRAFLSRRDALHALYKHYQYPNLSICRFATPQRMDYAADLVFEIDAHDVIPASCPLAWFTPYISAAVEVGRRIFDFLVGEMDVDARYLTTSVTRLGARVTVDWRAFGPRRLYQILGVVRCLEHTLFGTSGLSEIASKYGIPKLEVDGRIYQRTDAPLVTEAMGNTFFGPWLRPLGALHTKSSDATWWYRTQPVDHDRFRVSEVGALLRLSRYKRKFDVSGEVFKWPEGRHPAMDRFIEDRPVLARRLIDLFEAMPLVELPSSYQDEVVSAQRRSTQSRVQDLRPREHTTKALEVFLRRAHIHDPKETGDKIEFPCVRPTCSSDGTPAAIFGGGAYSCFRCCQSGAISIRTVAAEMGFSLPHGTTSSSLTWETEASAPPLRHVQDDWGYGVVLTREELPTVQGAWARREQIVTEFLQSNARVLIDISEAGMGKSEGVRRVLQQAGLRARISVPRDDSKAEYLLALPGARNIQGRKDGVNCDNTDADYAQDRLDPVGRTVCSSCPSRKGCTYRAQFRGASNHSLVLAHGHLPFMDQGQLDNSSEVDVVDEDALNPRPIDLTPAERLRFTSMTQPRIEWPEWPAVEGEEHEEWANPTGDAGLDEVDVTDEKGAATQKLADFFAQLERRLTGDALAMSGVRGDELTDGRLARHLFGNREFETAFLAIDRDEVEAHEALRLDLIHTSAGRHAQREGKVTIPNDEGWEQAAERQEAREEALHRGEDPDMAEVMAYAGWQSTGPTKTISWPARARPAERPLNILKALIEALHELRVMHSRRDDYPARLLAFREDRGWTLRLWSNQKVLSRSSKIIMLSATMTPARAHLLLGTPEIDQTWQVVDLRIPRPERRIQVADHFLGKTGLMSQKTPTLRSNVFGTVLALVQAEHERTGLPVGVFGQTAVLNELVKQVMKKVPSRLQMPFKTERTEKLRELNDLLAPHHIMVGYAYGVAGSNDFHVVQDGMQRFIRSAILVGTPMVDLGDFTRQHRGLLAGYMTMRMEEDELIGARLVADVVHPAWTMTMRQARPQMQARDGMVPVVGNDIGYESEVADQVLYGGPHAEIIQLVGRMRPHLPDPVDPAIQPRTYYFGGLVIPGWEVDEVITLDDLRERLKLAPVGRKPGRPSTRTVKESIAKVGRKRLLQNTVRKWRKQGMSLGKIVVDIKSAFEGEGLSLTDADRATIEAAYKAA